MTRIVSFIIPALNEERRVGRCLESIQSMELAPGVDGIEIIVVDNCSNDRTAEISRGLGAIVEQTAPGHPSRARNLGARRAVGEWLAFVDADCELPRNWLTTCGAHLLRDREIVAVAGIMSGPAADATWVEHAWYVVGHRSGKVDVAEVRWLPTFNLLVRRSAFVAVNGFDESLATCEDCDLGYRLAKQGTLIVDPHAQVIHGGESRSLAELFRREAWRSRGNVRLALMRPFDVLNWLSLLFPPGVIAGPLLLMCGLAASLVAGWVVWPWAVGLGAALAAMACLLFRKTATLNPLSFSKQALVFLTYLGGRTAGLVWSFQRVER